MQTWKEIKHEMLKDPEVKRAYDELGPGFHLASDFIGARIAKKLSQSELAQKAGVSQVAIARLESGDANPTFRTASRVAKALGKEVRLVDAKQKSTASSP